MKKRVVYQCNLIPRVSLALRQFKAWDTWGMIRLFISCEWFFSQANTNFKSVR